MKILPTMGRFVLLHEDGSFELAPFQVFRCTRTGGAEIRIGRNLFSFDKDGHFTGNEVKAGELGAEGHVALQAAFDAQTKGTAPDEPYYQPGTSGYADEVRAWAFATPESQGDLYSVAVKKGSGS